MVNLTLILNHPGRYDIAGLIEVLNNQEKLMATLQDVLQKIAEQKTIADGLVSTFDAIKDKLAQAGVSQDIINQAFQGLAANNDELQALSDAMVANVNPPAPAPAPAPPADGQ